VAEDPQLRERNIEQTLDEASKLLQTCLGARRDYIDFAKLYVDTGLKSDEFFRTDAIHQQEVLAGLYNLPYDEATDDVTTSQATLVEATAQKTVVDSMYSAAAAPPKYVGTLTDPEVQAFSTQSGQIAQWSSFQAPNAAQIGTTAQTLSDYRAKLEDASWQYNLRATTANVSQLTGRLATAQRKQTYLRQDVGFRAARAAVSRQLAYIQLSENVRTGSPLNYNERLSAIRAVFDAALVKLIQRCKLLERACSSIYGINYPLTPPARGAIVDSASGWLFELQDRIAKFHRQQRISIFTFWFSQYLLRNNQNLLDAMQGSGGLRVDLNVQPSDSEDQTGLLRGAALEYLGSGKRPVRLTVVPPASAIAGPGARLNIPLVFGRVLSLAPGLDIRPQFSDILWNGNPYGTWRIASTSDLRRYGIEDIAFHLWLAY
jgi:hypothetical protein